MPFHPCNAVDGMTAILNPNLTLISSIFDTRFVAVHTFARSLLLPLHESVLSLICQLMLRGRVVQFGDGAVAERASQSTQLSCQDADISSTNQDLMINFMSSLNSEQYLLALPFSPRIQTGATLHLPAVQLTDAGSITTNDGHCPVDCSFNCWQSHRMLLPCAIFNTLVQCRRNYLQTSQR